MRTTLTIDDQVAADLMKATGRKSPVDAIRHALDDYLRQVRLQKVLALRGQVDVADDWRALRELERVTDVARNDGAQTDGAR